MPESLLQYYQRELQHLRLSAVEFARRFDRIATRLALKDGESKANVMLAPGDVIIIPESMF